MQKAQEYLDEVAKKYGDGFIIHLYDRNNCYKVLDIGVNTSAEKMNRKYKNLARANHPDKFSEGRQEEARLKFQIIGYAKKRICEHNTLAKYIPYETIIFNFFNKKNFIFVEEYTKKLQKKHNDVFDFLINEHTFNLFVELYENKPSETTRDVLICFLKKNDVLVERGVEYVIKQIISCLSEYGEVEDIQYVLESIHDHDNSVAEIFSKTCGSTLQYLYNREIYNGRSHDIVVSLSYRMFCLYYDQHGAVQKAIEELKNTNITKDSIIRHYKCVHDVIDAKKPEYSLYYYYYFNVMIKLYEKAVQANLEDSCEEVVLQFLEQKIQDLIGKHPQYNHYLPEQQHFINIFYDLKKSIKTTLVLTPGPTVQAPEMEEDYVDLNNIREETITLEKLEPVAESIGFDSLEHQVPKVVYLPNNESKSPKENLHLKNPVPEGARAELEPPKK